MAGKKRKRLTEKERKFVTAYMADANGNATEAAMIAGYASNRGSAKTLGNRLLTKVHILEEVAKRTARSEARGILSADERDEFLSSAIRGHGSLKDKIAAIKELNKVTGRHSVNINLKGKLTLEQVLGESRK